MMYPSRQSPHPSSTSALSPRTTFLSRVGSPVTSLISSDAVAAANPALSATGPAGDVVQAVVDLPSDVFHELNGALTALLPSPRRQNARRRQPSSQERQACRTDVQARGPRRRRRRCSRERGTVRGDGGRGENNNRWNTTGGTSASSTA